MKLALAHETIYPHLHPHAHVDTGIDALMTIFFLIALAAIVWGARYSLRRLQEKR